jgi:glycosyltransferase involved in cell wall biosynthesis
MVTWDEGQGDEIRIDGVRIVTVCRRDAGIPGLRFFHPRWSSLIAALRSADAELYYHNGAEYVSGQVAWWCRLRGRRFVFSSASNSDCDASLPLLPTWRERVLYRSALTRADRVIVQTEMQRQMLQANFNRDGIVLPMPCEDMAPTPRPERHHRSRLLWVGRVCEVKRPDRLLDIAERCADLHFDLVGASDGTSYAEDVMRRARTMSNITVHGGLTRPDVSKLLANAVALCCTSDIEGFPNTFLEAWCHGVPVVSVYDPDSLIASKGLGRVSTPSTLASDIRTLVGDRQEWDNKSRNARRYFLEHHTLDSAMPRFESLFTGLMDANG